MEYQQNSLKLLYDYEVFADGTILLPALEVDASKTGRNVAILSDVFQITRTLNIYNILVSLKKRFETIGLAVSSIKNTAPENYLHLSNLKFDKGQRKLLAENKPFMNDYLNIKKEIIGHNWVVSQQNILDKNNTLSYATPYLNVNVENQLYYNDKKKKIEYNKIVLKIRHAGFSWNMEARWHIGKDARISRFFIPCQTANFLEEGKLFKIADSIKYDTPIRLDNNYNYNITSWDELSEILAQTPDVVKTHIQQDDKAYTGIERKTGVEMWEQEEALWNSKRLK